MRYEVHTYRPDGGTQTAGVYFYSDRGSAVRSARKVWGTDLARVINLDAECQHCEDRPVPNAARWTDPAAPEYLPCPRCGKTNGGA